MHPLRNDAAHNDDDSRSSSASGDHDLLKPDAEARADYRHLFREMAVELRRYAARQVGPDEAEDLVSDTFLTVWRRWGDLSETHDHRRAWVYGVMKRNILEHRTLEARRRARQSEVAVDGMQLDARPVDEVVVSQEWVDEALARLPETQAVAIRLAVIDGYTAREVASQVGATTTAITTRISRGRAALREMLAARQERQ